MRLTQKAFAAHIGVTQPAVAAMVKADIVDLSKGMDKARLDYCAHMRRIASGHHQDGPELSLTTERALLARSSTMLNRVKLAEADAHLLDSKTVERHFAQAAADIKGVLQSIPARLASPLAGMSDGRDIELMLHREMNEALRAMGHHQIAQAPKADKEQKQATAQYFDGAND